MGYAETPRVAGGAVISSYRLYRRLGRARERDVPPTVWQLRHYWHFCRNCAGWPDGPPSQWRFTRASPELALCQASVGFARMSACSEASIESDEG